MFTTLIAGSRGFGARQPFFVALAAILCLFGAGVAYAALGDPSASMTIENDAPVVTRRTVTLYSDVTDADAMRFVPPIASIDSGMEHTLVLATDGTVWAWGVNRWEPCGAPRGPFRATPVMIGSDNDWVQISAGFACSIARKADGTLWAWGDNWYGQYGDMAPQQGTPRQIGSEAGWTDVSAGNTHVLAIRSGELWAWGENDLGQLGNDTPGTSGPVQVGTDTDWVTAFAGNRSSFAIKTDGSLWAWGSNMTGQLGTGDGANTSTPTQVGTDNDWLKVSMGEVSTHVLGLKADGSLYAWGDNYIGSLGLGFSGGAMFGPMPVAVGTSFNDIATAAYASVACANGTMYWWGNLGAEYASSPAQVVGLPYCNMVAAVPWTACFAVSGGDLWGWGDGRFLGNDSDAMVSTPMQIGHWESYSPMRPYLLPADDGASGTQVVSVMFRDAGGATRTLTDEVAYDFRGGTTSVAINWGAPYAQSTAVTLEIDAPTAVEMSIEGGEWVPAAGSAPYTLPDADGEYTVAVRFRDATLTEFSASDSITLDRQAPLGTMALNHAATSTRGRKVTIDSDFSDAVSMRIGYPSTWKSVSVGGSHAAALRTDGSLWTWGDGARGQLGDGVLQRSTPVRVPGGTWTAVAAGGSHTGAIKADGTLWMFGANESGQLGDVGNEGIRADRQLASQVAVPGGGQWSLVAAGENHTLALTTDGRLFAWGKGERGQLGDGGLSSSDLPSQVTPWMTFTAIAAGGDSSYAIDSAGALWAWGANDSGQMGNGAVGDQHAPVLVSGAEPAWTSISAGAETLAALRSDGTLHWSGRLGEMTASTLTQLDGTWLRASAGDRFIIAVKHDGTPWGVGANDLGQTAGESTVARVLPLALDASLNFSALDSGGASTVAVRSDGKLWAWGANGYGQLGDGTTNNVRYPINTDWMPYEASLVRPLPAASGTTGFACAYKDAAGNATTAQDNIVLNPGQSVGTMTATSLGGHSIAIASSVPTATEMRIAQPPLALGFSSGYWYPYDGGYQSDSSFIVSQDGPLHATGANWAGQLGDGTTSQRSAYTRTPGHQAWKAVAMGAAHTLAIKNDGSLWVWGSDTSGQLGDGAGASATPVTSPKMIDADGWVAVAAYGNASAAVRTDGSLYTWGSPSGDSGLVYRGGGPLTGIRYRQASLGSQHMLLLTDDGTLYASGENYYGQVGDGTRTGREAPVLISTGWKSVSAGHNHSLGIRTDNTLWAWGSNANGEIGNGGGSDRTAPTLIDSGSWQRVSASGSYGGTSSSAAIRADGSLWVWGDNSLGQLCDGTYETRRTPLRVGTGTEWSLVAAGPTGMLASTTDGAVYGWGTNGHGVLGPVRTPRWNSSPWPVQPAWLQDWNPPPAIWEPYQADKTIEIDWALGTTTFRVGYRDEPGNIDWLSSTAFVDVAPPETSILATPYGWSQTPVRIQLFTYDDCSPTTTYYRLGEGVTTTYTAPFEVSDPGVTRITFWAVDATGKIEGAQTYDVKIDYVAPVTTSTVTEGVFHDGAIYLSATDSLSGIASTWYSFDSEPAKPIAFPLPAVTEGPHTLEYGSIDKAGNIETTKTVNFVYDHNPPTTTTTPLPSGWSTKTVEVTIIAEDIAAPPTAYYTLDGGVVTTYTAPFTIGDGTHTLRYWSVDGAGHVDPTHTVTVKVDTAPPVTAASLLGGTAVELTPVDAVSGSVGTRYRVNGSAAATYTAPIPLGTSDMHLEFWSVDAAGNVEEIRSEVFDVLPPTTTISSIPVGWSTESVEISITAFDTVSSVIAYYRLDNGAVTEYSAPFMVGEGDHTLYYWSVDALGHVDPTETVRVQVDGTAPVTTCDDTWPWDTMPVLHATDGLSGLGSTWYSLDGGAPREAPIEPPLTQGEHLLEYWSIDVAGNRETPHLMTFRYILAPAPTGTVSFANDATAINTITVPVVSKITSVVDMKLGSGEWQPYSAVATMAVDPGDGPKQLSVLFRDEYGRITEFASQIILDTQAPTGTFSINAGDASTRFRTAVAVTSVSSDAVGIRTEPPAGWGQITIGSKTMLGVRGDGTLWGRGTDEYFVYTGNGLSTTNHVPGVFAQAGDGATYRSVAVHDYFAAGVKTDGSLWVWGDSQGGQLGVSGFAPVRLPIRLGTASNWSTVTVGGQSGAAITTGGALYTWGHNGQGQCGLGNSVTPQLTPVNVQAGTTWKAVSGGSGDTFVGIRTNGSLWTWGFNTSGQVGDNTQSVMSTPVQPNGTSGFTDWISVSARGTTTYAVRANGDLYAWGSNSYGQIGDGTTTDRLVPTLIGTGYKSVAGGEYHATAVKADGSLWGWGYNSDGQVGDGTSQTRLTPVRVGLANNWASVANGDSVSMATDNSGELWVWGFPVALYGNETGVVRPAPVRADWFSYTPQHRFTLPAGNGVKNVNVKVVDAAGNIGSLTDSITLNTAATPGTVVVEGGAAWAGTQTVVASITVPFAVEMTKDTPFTAVAAGGNSIGLIRGDGRLHSMGYNPVKKLGDTTSTNRSTPVSSTPLRDFVAVSYGIEHALGLAADGTLYGWGSERYGAVGTGHIGGPFGRTAAQVGAAGEWAKIAAGANHSLGLKKDGSVWAWGYGGNGALGLGADVQDKPLPTKVSGAGLVFTAISAGSTYSMAVRNDGTLWVWGTGSQYQLGIGAGTFASAPIQVGTATNWASVSAGSSHAMGLRTDGSAYVWGNNTYGQIGNSGAASSYNTPQALGSVGWQSLSAGDDFSTGIRTDGSLWAWGRSDRYQTATGNAPTVPRRIDAATDWVALDAGTASVVALKRDGAVYTWGGNVYGELGTGAGTVGVSTWVPTAIMPSAWQSVIPTAAVFVERGGLDTNIAFGFRDIAGNVSVVGDRIGFDYTPPVTTATGIPRWWGWDGTFTLAATDPGAGVAHTFYNFDGGSPTTYTSEVAISTEGTTLVGYWSVDLYGNAEAPKYGYVLVDSTAPVIGWNIPSAGWLATDTLSVSATDALSGVNSHHVWLNGSPRAYENHTYAYDVHTATYRLTEGSHLVRVEASNRAGAYSERSQTVSVDFTPPSSTATGIPTGWSPTDAVISIAATDALSGMAGVRYQVDGSAASTYSAPIVIGDGIHTLRWWAVDVAGNAEPAHVETLTIDTSFPGSVSTIDDTWRKTPQTFSIVSTDALSGWSGTSYRIDGGPDMPYSVPVTVSDEGTHTVEYWAWDLMGNIESPKKTGTIRIDYSPPHTVLLGAPAGVSAAVVELVPMATDAGVGVAQTYYRINGGQVRPFTADQTAIIVADEGTTTVEYWSVDLLGHVESRHSLDVVVDYVASGGGSGTTTSNAPCITCHGAAGAPPQMAVNFGVQKVDRETACPRCHTYGLAGTHPNHYAGGNCGAVCHRGLMGASTLAATPTKITPYGSFASLGSKDTTSGDLHVIHAAVRWPGSITKGDSKCSSCHAPAACEACHSGALSPLHAEHSSIGNPRYTARAPVATRICYGVVGEDQSFVSVTESFQQCGIGECHNTAGLAEAEPVSFEDFTHAAIGTKPANTVVKTGTWMTQTKTAYSMQRRSASVVKGSTLGISFMGTKVAISGGKGPNFGELEVSIDGVVVATINGYSPTVVDKTTLFTSSTLVRGPHTVSVRVTGVRPAGSSGIAVAVDEFLVWDKQPSAVAPACTQSCHPDRVTAHGYEDVDHVADSGASIEPVSGARCDACHSMDLMAEHTRKGSVTSAKGCATCHDNPRRTFGSWNQSCQQGGCHTPGTTEQRHAGLPTVHDVSMSLSCTKNCHETAVSKEHAKDAGRRSAVGCVECHNSPEYVAGVRSVPAATWSKDCNACHPSTHAPNAAGNGLCLDCHGASSAAIDALVGAGTWNNTGGDHGAGYAGSAHGSSVMAGSDGAVPSNTACEACHNHNAIGAGAATEFRTAGGRQGQSALCFECHSASGDETRTPVPNTWNGRDLAVEFARPSAHPVEGASSVGTTREETVGVFTQSTPIELAANNSFQVSASSTMGAQLLWDSWTIPSVTRPLLFLAPESVHPDPRSFSQYDPDLNVWNGHSYDPTNPAAGTAYYGSSGLAVQGKFVWSVGQGFDTRMSYTPINVSSPDSWNSLSPLPFVADRHVLSSADPDAGLVYYAGNNTAGTVYRWFAPTDTWMAPFVMKSAGGTPIDFTSSDFAYSPINDRLYAVTKNFNQAPVIRWVDSPSTASGQATYSQQVLAQPGSTWGSGDLYMGLTRFTLGGTDYLVYEGPTSDAFGGQRAYLISGLASGVHSMTPLPEFFWYHGGKGTKLLWDGGDYIYALHENSGPNPGRIRVPADPLTGDWGTWELLPTPPTALGEVRNGSMAFLRVSTANIPVTGYLASGTMRAEIDLPADAIGWGEFAWASFEPLGTELYMSVEGWNGASWTALPGMANKRYGPLDLSGIDSSAYRRIRLTAQLVTNSETITPSLRGWSVTARIPVDDNSGVASLSCASCHNSHTVEKGAGAWDVVRVSQPGNTTLRPTDMTTFCLECHSSGNLSRAISAGNVVPYDIGFSVFGSDSFFPGWEKDVGPAAFKKSGHFTTSGTKALCENCHDPHASQNPRLTAWTKPTGFVGGRAGTRDNTSSAGFEEKLCFQCHGNGVVGTQAPGAQDVASVVLLPYRHDPSASGLHSDAESAVDNGTKRHAECTDCHDPHAAQPAGDRLAGGVPIASPALLGATGLKPIWGSTPGSTLTSYTATRLLGRPGDVEAYVCFKCHTSASGRPAAATSGGVPYTSTDLAAEFNPNNQSFHNVLGLSKGMKDSFLVDGTTYTWTLPPDASFLKPGWTRNSAVTCSDCHTSGAMSSAKGPHGSSVRFLIDPAYPADYRQASLDWREPDNVWPTGQVICTKCHVFSPTQNDAHGARALAQGAGNKIHTREYDDTMKCTSCHIAIPHGWKRPRLLINSSDPAAYRSPYARGPLKNIKLRNRTPNDWPASDCAGCGSWPHPDLGPVWP